MPVSRYIDYTNAIKTYGDLVPSMGFHTFLLEAGIRRAESKIHHTFLKRICRSAMSKGNAHTIVLESFGKPLLILQNLSYAFQPFKERKVYVVHLEKAYVKWKNRNQENVMWDTIVLSGLCALGIGLLTMYKYK
jgi:hypothetical protein